MRRNLIAVLFALAAVGSAVPAEDFNSREWRDEIARGFLPYRKLAYEDFPVSDGVQTPHLMHTEGFVHYSYKMTWTASHGTFAAKVTQFTVRSGYDSTKSWRRSGFTETKALLAHEQGHLDISELHAADFRLASMPEGISSTAQGAMDALNVKMQAVCDRYCQEAKVEQDRYDQETNHGLNGEQQRKWNQDLHDRVAKAGLTYWDQDR